MEEERLQLADQLGREKIRTMEEEKTRGDHDLISELPESMIVTIMSFLPMEDATRFSFASKKFLPACKSIPILDFDFFSFMKNNSNGFVLTSFHNFVAQCLQFRINASNDCSNNDTTCCSQRLSFVGPINNILVYKIVDFSLHYKIKELNLSNTNLYGGFDITSPDCGLPNTLFFAKHLTSLKIKGFYFKELEDQDLVGVSVNEDLVGFHDEEGLEDQDLVLSCPLIEDISLSCCNSFKTITLFGDKLKHVVLDSCPQLMKINIDPQVRLESFSYSSAVSGQLGQQQQQQQQKSNCEILFAIGSFKLLKFLELKNTDIVTDEWFQDYVSGLNLLETLKLNSCSRLKNICIGSDNLKTLELEKCEEVEIIYITAPNLESFLFDILGEENHCKTINISSTSKYLKNMILRGAGVTDKWIGDILSRFLYLEHLELKDCKLLQNIKFFAGKLTSLKLLTCTELSKIKIKVPNLVSFVYDGNVLPSPPVLNSTSRLHAKLLLSTPSYITKSYRRLFRDFMVSFDHCERLHLDISIRVLIYPEIERENMIPPLYDLKHVEVRWNRTRNIVRLVEGLLWLVPKPETISIMLHDHDLKVKSSNLKFHYKRAVEEENSYCCTFHPIKCWRHFFLEVEMDNFDDSYERSSVQNFLIKNAMGLTTIICNTH